MYEEMRKIDWLSLFVKVTIVLVFSLLIIWLVIKISNRSSEKDFESNMNTLKNASIEYFKNGNLPTVEGENAKVTLEELIKSKYIDNFDKSCDQKTSYAQATLVDDYYAIRIELECKDKKDYIYTSIDSDGNCVGDTCCVGDSCEGMEEEENNQTNEDQNNEENENSDNGNNTEEGNSGSSNNSGSNNNSGSSGNSSTTDPPKENGGSSGGSTNDKVLYYEHVKVNKVYGNWQYQKISGSNVETKKESVTLNTYCKLVTTDYYVVGYVSGSVELGERYRFSIRLNNVPSSTTYFKFLTKEFFNNNASMYQTYLNSPVKTTFKLGGNAYGMVSSPDTLRYSSLKSNNMDFVRAYYYSEGSYINVDVWVQINNRSGVITFNNLYFVPIHLKVEYKDNGSCVTDTAANASKYKNYMVSDSRTEYVTLYRSYTYQRDNSDIKWSTSKSLSGYELTGRTQWR